jgi:selenocysteine-specific elongation factor
MVYPPLYKARVRSLQMHGASVEELLAGSRAAVNLQGLEKEEMERGMVVATPGSLIPSRRLDAFLEVLASAPRPLKHRQAVRFHTGTSERLSVPLLLDADEVTPGSSGYVQFILRDAVAVKPGDRFVIRNLSPAITWGGGQILHVNPTRHKRHQEGVLAGLQTLEQGAPEEQVRFYLAEAGPAGRSRPALAAMLPWEPTDLAPLLNALVQRGEALLYDPENQRYILTDTARALEEDIHRHLKAYHQKNPLKPGLSKEELRRKLPPQMEVRLFNDLLGRLARQKQVALEKDLVRLASHRVQLATDQEDVTRRLEVLYKRGRLSPPTLKEVEAALKLPLAKLQPLLAVLVNQGSLVKVKEDLYFHTEAVAQLKAALVDFLKKNGEISVMQFKDLTQTSRKFTIPLLEHFDTNRVTVRVGEARRLREGV